MGNIQSRSVPDPDDWRMGIENLSVLVPILSETRPVDATASIIFANRYYCILCVKAPHRSLVRMQRSFS
jgi:hypothetical protein